MTARALLVLGGGGHAAVVIEEAARTGFVVVGYLDDAAPAPGLAPVEGMVHLGRLGDLAAVRARFPHAEIHAAIGSAALREAWLAAAEAAGATLATVVAASAQVSPSASIGAGSFVGPRVVVAARARVGRGVLLNTAAVVEHDVVVDDLAHVASGAIVCGGARVGRCAHVAAGSTIPVGMVIPPAGSGRIQESAPQGVRSDSTSGS